MLVLRIDASLKEPVYKQVARQVIELVESDALKEGDILPPTRELSTNLAVSRFTVAQAYRELWAKGYVDSRPGSYTRVRRRPKLAASRDPGIAGGQGPSRGCGPARDRAPGRPEDRPFPMSEGARAALGAVPPAGFLAGRKADGALVDFAPMSLDERLFPVAAFKTALGRTLTARNASILNYADSAGYLPLREFVADRMRTHGIATAAEGVVVTHGSLQGIELAAKLLVSPGDGVVVEEPTFSSVIPLFRLLGADIRSAPVGAGGMDLDRLEALLGARGRRRGAGRPPVLVYSIPTFHNPTGITTSQAHRERLLDLCERHRTPLLEDSFQEEITYFGRVVLPIKSMDSSGSVIYVGSFSKVLFPGARIGFIVASEALAARLAALKRVSDISCSPLVQAALHRFCASGEYDLHLRRVNRIFARRMAAAVEALRRHLPPDMVEFEAPSGGYLVWLRLVGLARTEAEIQAALARRGVRAVGGSQFFASRRGSAGRFLRLCISSLDEAEIEEGARRLGDAIRDLAGS